MPTSMPTNYKLLYEQMGKMVDMYQNEIVPQMRELIDKRVEVVRCKDCKHRRDDEDFTSGHYCVIHPHNGGRCCEDNDFCSYGERKGNEDATD